MASESKKPRVEESQEDSSILMKTVSLKDSSKEVVKKELYKLPMYDKIDFTIKSHITDATFIIEGKKIYAGSDFLCLLSSFFNALLKGVSFAESNMEEIELKDVTYDEFHEMLLCLSDQTRVIAAEHIESLLDLGDRYDIKCLVDRAEKAMINSPKFSRANKLILAERYRLIKLETLCRPSLDDLMPPKGTHILRKFDYLREVQNMEEPENGFIETGMRSFEYSERLSRDIEVAGLLWAVVKVKTEDDPQYFSLCLVGNQNRKSSMKWSAEGFVQVKMAVLSIHNWVEQRSVEFKFEFSLSNSKPGGRMRLLALTNNYKANDSTLQLVYASIYVTKVSGVRHTPAFDFSVPSEFTDAAFIVEGKKIHVNKQYLSTISPRFLQMFYYSKEVNVNNITHQELIEFLLWIYPSARRTSDVSTMFSVLKVADELNVNVDRFVVSDFIEKSNNPTEPGRDHTFHIYFIFHFQFKLVFPGHIFELYIHRYLRASRRPIISVFDEIKRSPLLARMSPVKKAEMFEFILELISNGSSTYY